MNEATYDIGQGLEFQFESSTDENDYPLMCRAVRGVRVGRVSTALDDAAWLTTEELQLFAAVAEEVDRKCDLSIRGHEMIEWFRSHNRSMQGYLYGRAEPKKPR